MHDQMEQIANRMAALERENSVLRANNAKLTADVHGLRQLADGQARDLRGRSSDELAELHGLRALVAEINAALGLQEDEPADARTTLDAVRRLRRAANEWREQATNNGIHAERAWRDAERERRRRIQAVRWARAMSKRCAHWRAVALSQTDGHVVTALAAGTGPVVTPTSCQQCHRPISAHSYLCLPGEPVIGSTSKQIDPVPIPAVDLDVERFRCIKLAKELAAPQPPPHPGHTSVLSVCKELLEQRTATGREKYGTVLEAGNGRDALVDAIQEAGDQFQYLVQLWLERQHEESELARLTALRPRADWQESDGPVLWWAAGEWFPGAVGPFPDRHSGLRCDDLLPKFTHWTPLPTVRT